MSAPALDDVALRALAPLDALRARLLRRFGRGLAPLLRDRALRTTVLGVVSVLAAFAITRSAPLVLLALGPILLGVPHLVADVRYLVVRRGLHTRGPVLAFAFVPLVLVLFVPTLEVAGIATLGAALAAHGTPLRRVAVLCLGAALLTIGLCTGRAADIVFAHVHNVIAIGLWWAMRPRTRAIEACVPLLALACALCLCFGALDLRGFATFSGVLPLEGMVRTLSPVDDPSAAFRWVALFAFGQAVHYAIWLRVIPEDARERSAPRSFGATYRALKGELGVAAVLVCLALTAAIIGAACLDLVAARDLYLRLALFHGPLEVALAGLAFAEGRRP